PARVRVLARALLVGRHVDVLEPGLALAHAREAVDQGDLAGADRLDLGPGQDDASLDRLVDEVVVESAAAGRADPNPARARVPGHRSAGPRQAGAQVVGRALELRVAAGSPVVVARRDDDVGRQPAPGDRLPQRREPAGRGHAQARPVAELVDVLDRVLAVGRL